MIISEIISFVHVVQTAQCSVLFVRQNLNLNVRAILLLMLGLSTLANVKWFSGSTIFEKIKILETSKLNHQLYIPKFVYLF